MTEKRTDTEDDVESDKALDERIAEALRVVNRSEDEVAPGFLDVAAHPPLGRQLGRTAPALTRQF